MIRQREAQWGTYMLDYAMVQCLKRDGYIFCVLGTLYRMAKKSVELYFLPQMQLLRYGWTEKANTTNLERM
jgi:hypothetical protein